MSIENKIKSLQSLATYTSFKLGGPAQYFLEVTTQTELEAAVQWAKTKDLPMFILGGGSNLLIADKGLAGLVIKIAGRGCLFAGEQVSVETGLPLANLVGQAMKRGLTGLEWAAGIPGSVGGAIRGNAGAYGGEMKDVLCAVTAYHRPSNQWRQLAASDCAWAYRHSLFKENQDWILWSADLKLATGNKTDIRSKMLTILQQRKAKLPTEASAGCMFKNLLAAELPATAAALSEYCQYDKLAAGKLIELLGFKAVKVGDIGVSAKHANFIVNYGQGKTSEVLDLVKQIQDCAKQHYGLKLDTEVEMLGFEA